LAFVRAARFPIRTRAPLTRRPVSPSTTVTSTSRRRGAGFGFGAVPVWRTGEVSATAQPATASTASSGTTMRMPRAALRRLARLTCNRLGQLLGERLEVAVLTADEHELGEEAGHQDPLAELAEPRLGA